MHPQLWIFQGCFVCSGSLAFHFESWSLHVRRRLAFQLGLTWVCRLSGFFFLSSLCSDTSSTLTPASFLTSSWQSVFPWAPPRPPLCYRKRPRFLDVSRDEAAGSDPPSSPVSLPPPSLVLPLDVADPRFHSANSFLSKTFGFIPSRLVTLKVCSSN